MSAWLNEAHLSLCFLWCFCEGSFPRLLYLTPHCSARHPLHAAPYFMLPSASFCLFSIRCWHMRSASNTTGTVPVWWGGEVRLFYLTKAHFIHIFRHWSARAKCLFKKVVFLVQKAFIKTFLFKMRTFFLKDKLQRKVLLRFIYC